MIKKMFFGFTALIAFAVMATGAFASSHGGAIVDAISLSPFQAVMIVAYDNMMHVFDHVVLTMTVLIQNPGSAMMVLDGIGAACFSAAPPASHALFATGALAIMTTMVSLVLAFMLAYMVFSRVLRLELWRARFGRSATYA